MLLLGATAACGFSCGAERFSGGSDAGARPPAGSGGSGFGTGGTGTGGDGTGGDGTGGDGTGGDGTGGMGTGGMGTSGDATGGSGSGGSGGAPLDTAPDLPPVIDARDTRPAEDKALAGGDASDGIVDAAPDAVPCVNGTRDLSNIGTGNFHISFRIATTQAGRVALLNQRSMCFYDVFWDIRQTPDGTLDVETDDGTSEIYRNVRSTAAINDGALHDVVVARVARTMTIQIDGAPAGTGASLASLGPMAPLRIGTDVCNPTSNPPTATFAGTTLSDVCITRR